MNAWTYDSAPSAGPYWRSTYDGPVVCLEYPNGHLEWWRVSDGTLAIKTGIPGDYHKGKLLPIEDYPPWLLDMDDLGMDVGL